MVKHGFCTGEKWKILKCYFEQNNSPTKVILHSNLGEKQPTGYVLKLLVGFSVNEKSTGVRFQVPCVTCHVSVSSVTCFCVFFLDKVVKLVGGGSVINGGLPRLFFFLTLYWLNIIIWWAERSVRCISKFVSYFWNRLVVCFYDCSDYIQSPNHPNSFFIGLLLLMMISPNMSSLYSYLWFGCTSMRGLMGLTVRLVSMYGDLY